MAGTERHLVDSLPGVQGGGRLIGHDWKLQKECHTAWRNTGLKLQSTQLNSVVGLSIRSTLYHHNCMARPAL
jgi:hypothetical protein